MQTCICNVNGAAGAAQVASPARGRGVVSGGVGWAGLLNYFTDIAKLHVNIVKLHTPYTLKTTPHTLCTTPYTLYTTSHILRTTPHTLCTTPYTLHVIHYTQHPTPYTLHVIHYTLHPTPYTLHPTPPYTLHPTHYSPSCCTQWLAMRGEGRRFQRSLDSDPPSLSRCVASACYYCTDWSRLVSGNT